MLREQALPIEDLRRLDTCDERIQRIFLNVAFFYHCRILEGHVPLKRATSRVKSSRMVRAAPAQDNDEIWHEDEKGLPHYFHFAGWVEASARSMGLTVRWHGWDHPAEHSLFELLT